MDNIKTYGVIIAAAITGGIIGGFLSGYFNERNSAELPALEFNSGIQEIISDNEDPFWVVTLGNVDIYCTEIRADSSVSYGVLGGSLQNWSNYHILIPSMHSAPKEPETAAKCLIHPLPEADE